MGIRRARFGEMKVDADQSITISSAGTPQSIVGSNVSKGEYSERVTLDPDAGANPDMKIRVHGGGKILLVGTAALTDAGQTPSLNLFATPEGGSETELAEQVVQASGDHITISEVYDAPKNGYVDFELKCDNSASAALVVEAGARFRVQSLD